MIQPIERIEKEVGRSNLSRRDLLNAAARTIEAALLAACTQVEGLPEPGEPLDPLVIDAARDLIFPTSPFSKEEYIGSENVSIFGVDDKIYRVITLDASYLAPTIREDNFNAYAENALTAVTAALSRHDKIIKIQRMIEDPVEKGKLIPDPNEMILPGTIAHIANAKQLESVMDPKWFKGANSDELAKSQAIVQYVLQDSSLDKDSKANIITGFADPKYAQQLIDLIDKYKDSSLFRVDDIPEDTPLDIFAEIHSANFFNPRMSQDDRALFEAIGNNAGTTNCYFVPKASKEFRESIADTVKEGFYDVPQYKPDVYILVEPNGDERMFITHDRQNKSAFGNHDFQSKIVSEDNPSVGGYHPTAKDQFGDESWELLEGHELTEFLNIHNVKGEDRFRVHKLVDKSLIRFGFVPNKFWGSSQFNARDLVKGRIVTMLKPKTTGSIIDRKYCFIGSMLRDNLLPEQRMINTFGNMITDVTERIEEAQRQNIRHLSRVGFLTPSEYFYKLFKGIQEVGGHKVHHMYLPDHPYLNSIMMDLLIRALDDKPIHELNWAIASKQTPLYKIQVKNFSWIVHEPAKVLGIESLQDSVVETPWLDGEGIPMVLEKGEMMLASPKFLNIENPDGTTSTYIVLGFANRDGKEGILDKIYDFTIVDKLEAYVIKVEDALDKIMLIDDDANFVKAIGNIIKIGGIAAGIFLTLYYPAVLPNIFKASSLTISSKYKFLINALNSALGNKLFQMYLKFMPK